MIYFDFTMPSNIVQERTKKRLLNLVHSGNWYTILVESSLSGTGLKLIPISDSNLDGNARFVSVKD